MIKQKSTTKILLLFFCILGLSCKNSTEITETKSTDRNVEKFQTIIDSIYQSNPESIGIMVHIESPKNGISWSGSVGYSDKENKTDLLPNQPALIASSIKTYISASILRLQEQGELSIEQNISKYLTQKTNDLFKNDGYDFDTIKIKHLLSHTSGIEDYANDAYVNWVDKNRKYRWTRDEQLELTTKVGNPLGKPQDISNYADANYLLCTEIIEQITKKPFYEAIRDLLKYEQLGFKNTWFPTLENKPNNTKELVHQYWSERAWDSYNMDISFDLYGGGGIATTTKELAQFSYNLFNNKIIENKDILNLLSTEVKTADGKNNSYGLGLSIGQTKGFVRYGHGGFWGSQVLYFPKLHTSISVFVLERDVKNKVIKQTIESLVTEISNDSFLEESIIEENYQLYKAKDSKATLVLFPGGGSTAKETKEEFDIITAATANNISVLFMNFNGGLWIDNETTKDLANDLESAFTDNKVNTKNTFIGGMSIGGNVALTLSNYLNQQKSNIITKGVFIVDSPIDLYALYESSIKDILNPNFDEERLAEPKWIVNYFEKEFSKDSLLINIQEVSPFIGKNKNTSVPNLKNSKVRFYIEPDSLWYKEIRLTDFESTNAYAIQQIARDLKTKNWNQLELIETQGKGYRANGERNPHSWSIVNVDELIEWILE
jgi:D-alanyl-D-alanine carboxypeptidase